MQRRNWIVAVMALGILAARPASAGGPAPARVPAEARIREAWSDFIFAPGPGTARAFAKAAESAQGTGPKGQPATDQALRILSESAGKLAEGLASRGPDPALLPYATACLRLMAELFPEDADDPAGALDARQRLEARLKSSPEAYEGLSEPKAGDEVEAACVANLAATKSDDPAYKHFWIRAAIPEYERAVAVDSGSWYLLFSLGWAYFDGLGDFRKAAEYFARAEAFADCPAYVYRMHYRAYEHLLDFPLLLPAMERAKLHGLEDEEHQKLVARDIEYWRTHKDDPEAHRAMIVRVNAHQRDWGAPSLLYPEDPFWVVCPDDGIPSPKGSEACQNCGRKFGKAAP